MNIFLNSGYTESGRLGIGPYNPKNPYVVTPQLVQGLNNIIKVVLTCIMKYLNSFCQTKLYK